MKEKKEEGKQSNYRTTEQRMTVAQKRVDAVKSKIEALNKKLAIEQAKLDALKAKSTKSAVKKMLKTITDEDLAKMFEMWQNANSEQS